MKRLSKQERQKLKYRALSARRALWKSRARNAGPGPGEHRRITRDIQAPPRLILTNADDRIKTLNFLAQLNQLAETSSRIKIDFSKIEKLYPCGTLLFMAHVDRIMAKHPGKITCNYPDDQIVEQLFTHIGLLERLGLSSRIAITSDQVIHWHYEQGNCADLRGLTTLLQDYEESLSLEIRSRLFANLSEAVANTINHAYPGEDESQRHWWLFGQRKDGMLLIAVCDQGIGIPRSLAKKPLLRDYRARLRRIHRHKMDEFMIADAVGSPRTVTEMPHRGKGLPEMLDFVKRLGNGSLSIISGTGGFFYSAEENVEQQKNGTWKDPVHGTLVFWKIPLN